MPLFVPEKCLFLFQALLKNIPSKKKKILEMTLPPKFPSSGPLSLGLQVCSDVCVCTEGGKTKLIFVSRMPITLAGHSR